MKRGMRIGCQKNLTATDLWAIGSTTFGLEGFTFDERITALETEIGRLETSETERGGG
jgi:hypothetical protein